jgi:hypothetical protein
VQLALPAHPHHLLLKCPAAAVLASGGVCGLQTHAAAAFAWMNWLIRKLRQSCLTSCVQTASQSMYNSAWLGFEFVLDYRQVQTWPVLASFQRYC